MTSRFDTLADETAAPLSRGWMIIALNVYLLAVLTALPVAQVPLPQLPQTATVYASGLTVTEASTAFLLFNLALPIQSRTVLLLGCAYLFAAAMAVLHLLSYPGALIADQPAIGGQETVGWLYLVWRMGFPTLIILALMADKFARRRTPVRRFGLNAVLSGATVLGVAALAGVATARWHARLPLLYGQGGSWTSWNVIGSTAAIALCCIATVTALILTKGRRTLYLWLCLALLAFAGDVLLGLVGGRRYTVGWYAARASGLLAGGCVFLLFLARFARQNRMLGAAVGQLANRAAALQAEIGRREAAEHQLLEARKMEAIGHLTGGIAHNFNNLLTVISGRMSVLKPRLKDAALERHVDAIDQAVDRCASLIRHLLTFARHSPTSPRVIILEEEMPRLAETLRMPLPHNIEFALEVAPGTSPIKVDLAELELALLNATSNALDAMPRGGRLTISAANMKSNSELLQAGMEDLSVAIHISDTGGGIPEAALSHVFEPFYTTKEPGKGTGLGLAQIHGFVHQAGGRVAISSTLGQGTILTLLFPSVVNAPGITRKRSV